MRNNLIRNLGTVGAVIGGVQFDTDGQRNHRRQRSKYGCGGGKDIACRVQDRSSNNTTDGR